MDLSPIANATEYLPTVLALTAVWRMVKTLRLSNWVFALYFFGVVAPTAVFILAFVLAGGLSNFVDALASLLPMAVVINLLKLAAPIALWLIADKIRADLHVGSDRSPVVAR